MSNIDLNVVGLSNLSDEQIFQDVVGKLRGTAQIYKNDVPRGNESSQVVSSEPDSKNALGIVD